MNFLMDFLGGARYPKVCLQEQPREFGFGIFAEVDGFGKSYNLIKEMGNLNLPLYRTHLMWKDLHDFKESDLKEVGKRAKLLAPIYKDIDGKKYVSPCCENKLDAVMFERFADVTMSVMPKGVELVNSPIIRGGHVSKKYINEYHHEKSRGGRSAFSYDGANIVDSDFVTDLRLHNKAEYFGIWNSQSNGNRKVFTDDKERGEFDFKDREKRIYFPTPKQIDSWIYIATHEKGKTSLPKNWIFKSHSDQHSMPPEGKDQKPVWVKLPKFRSIKVKALNGQLIDEAPYFGTFKGGGHRYYHNDWGFVLSEKAKRIQGHGLCNVFANDKLVGKINLAFRDGVYR